MWKIGSEIRKEEKKNRKYNRNQRKDDSGGGIGEDYGNLNERLGCVFITT
jgi:hypothetical protein